MQTANILGALQLAIKGHELAIVASLVFIAKQWIHDSLLDLNKGVILGLVGAELSLSAPSFVISKEFLTAIRYGLSGGFWWDSRKSEATARKREMALLGGFLFIACIVASLAGPASGVLMIPRVQWFFDQELILSVPDDTDPYRGIHYPNMLIDPQNAVGRIRSGSRETHLQLIAFLWSRRPWNIGRFMASNGSDIWLSRRKESCTPWLIYTGR